MRPIMSPAGEQVKDPPSAASQPQCPVCSGLLVELRGFVRCSRCHFSMCAGCEGEAWGMTTDQ